MKDETKGVLLTPTCILRWYKEEVKVDPINIFDIERMEIRVVLQQKWVDEKGNEEWKNIPTENNFK